jgi:hypothetical protein
MRKRSIGIAAALLGCAVSVGGAEMTPAEMAEECRSRTQESTQYEMCASVCTLASGASASTSLIRTCMNNYALATGKIPSSTPPPAATPPSDSDPG